MKRSRINRAIIKEYLEENPETPTHSLANLIYKENPKNFEHKEQIRSVLRYYRGQLGKTKDQLKDKRFVQDKSPEPRNKYSFPPEWDRETGDPFALTHSSIAILSDVHAPFHDIDALNATFDYLKTVDIEGIVLNGDIWDCYSLSSFTKDPRYRDFKQELESIRGFLDVLRKEFPNVEIYYKEGNHEFRFKKNLMNHAPDFFGITEFRPEVLLGLFEKNIHWIDNKRIIKLGELDILHGHELPGNSTGGILPARTLFNKVSTTSLCGHFHQISQYKKKTLGSAQINCYTTGCLCNLFPDFLKINQWKHGFALAQRDEDNNVIVTNIEV